MCLFNLILILSVLHINFYIKKQGSYHASWYGGGGGVGEGEWWGGEGETGEGKRDKDK